MLRRLFRFDAHTLLVFRYCYAMPGGYAICHYHAARHARRHCCLLRDRRHDTFT